MNVRKTISTQKNWRRNFMKKLYIVWMVMLAASLLLAGCGGASTATKAPAAANDLLATIQKRGTLVGFTDPAYPPQSSLKADPKRTEGTKCAEDQKTLGELEGIDIDVMAAVAKAIGVEPCFVTPDWGMLVAGGWSDRWDIAVGSVTITPERAKVLYFAQPYKNIPAALYVNAENTSFKAPADLSGKKVGVCSGCTYESYLGGTLVIPGVPKIDYVIKDADIKGYDTDTTALQDLALGDGLRLDAVLTAQPTGEQFIKDGGAVKQLGDPPYYEFDAPAFDRASSMVSKSLIAKVNQVIQGMHADGSLKQLSTKWYGADYTSAAATFDISLLNK
jgi:polar amino acid transport system substrate-binding protein